MNCKNCGSVMKDGSIFCGKCGSKMETGGAQICQSCNREVPEEMFFCPNCGTKMKKNPPQQPTYQQPQPVYQPQQYQQTYQNQPQPVAGGVLTISRDSQLTNALYSYKITINGIDHGNMTNGQTRTFNVSTGVVDVEIACTSFASLAGRIHLKLRLGSNPHIRFKIKNGILGTTKIAPTVTGAEIISQS